MSLSDVGVLQASQLALRLAGETIAVVYASPLDRTYATAAAIAAEAGVAVEMAPAINEIDFGSWTGARFDELQDDPAWRQWNEARGSACPPDGEAMVAAQARAVAYVEHVAAKHAGSAIALVSHCDIIRATIAHYLGLSLDNLLRFDIDPASVSRLLVGPWGGRVVSVNERIG